MTRLGWLGLAGAAAIAPLVAAQQTGVLAKVQPGLWQLKEVGVAGARSLCVTDPAMMLQVVHGDARCTRTVIDSGPTALTVRYTCPGIGHGLSTVTLRTPSAFRLQTQGLTGGAPFDYDFEARRVGDCAAPAPTPGGVH